MKATGYLSRLLPSSLLVLLLACRAPEPIPGGGLEAVRAALPVRKDANVIVVSFDALRADALGLYGYDRPTSPGFDEFAERSLVFDRAHTVAPVTPTSFAAAFSGLLPTRVFSAWKFTAEETLASRFREAGYATAALVNSVQLTPERGFDRGFDHYVWKRNDPDDEFLEEVATWFEERRDVHPLFAWVHFLVPHAPYVYRPIARELYDESYEGRFRETTGGKFETDDPREIARIRTLYDGQVRFADSLLGHLVDRLDASGWLEDSIVVVTSDHGEEFYERGGFQHGKLYEEHVRIPLLVYHPDAARGSRSDLIVSNVDLLPTLLAVVGHPTTDPLDGLDLLALDRPLRRVIGVSMTGAEDRYLSLRWGELKLILTCMPAGRSELYDLSSDPGELVDLAGERTDQVEAFDGRLATILGGPPCQTMNHAIRGAGPTVGLDEESVEALRALGYL